MKVYVVVVTADYIPYVPLVTNNRSAALKFAKDYANLWSKQINTESAEYGELFFSQEEDGNMDNSVTVEAVKLKWSWDD